MNMNKEKKKEILLKNFEIIKNNFQKNHYAIGETVCKMFGVDENLAIDLWIFLLNMYREELKGENSYSLTGHITYEGSKIIGEKSMHNIILNTPEIRQALFSYSRDDSDCESIIVDKIISNELGLANELLELLYNNKFKEQSWGNIIDWCLVILKENTDTISEEGFELLNMWCEKIDDEEQRAGIIIKLMGFV